MAEKDTSGPSGQYHNERKAIVGLSVVLFCYRVFGVYLDGAYPIIDKFYQLAPEFVPLVGCVVLLYLIMRIALEWVRMPAAIRADPALRFDCRLTLAIGLSAVGWVSWPYAAEGGLTPWSGLWLLLMLGLGTCHGAILHSVAMLPFLLRPVLVAKRLGLPRVPTAALSQIFLLFVLIMALVLNVTAIVSMRTGIERHLSTLFVLLGIAAYFAWAMSFLFVGRGYIALRTLLDNDISRLRAAMDCMDADLMTGGQIQMLPRIMEPIHLAAESGRIDELKPLLESKTIGFIQDQAGHWGWTPLLYAAAEGRREAVRMLLSYAADPNKANVLGRTPLMFASAYGHHNIVLELLGAGAGPNERSMRDGRTALIDAAETGHERIVEILLSHHADPIIRDYWGVTALTYASINKHGECAARLRQATGSENDSRRQIPHISTGTRIIPVSKHAMHGPDWVKRLRTLINKENDAPRLVAKGQPLEAIRILRAVRRSYVKELATEYLPRVDVTIGQIYAMCGDWDRAVRHLRLAMRRQHFVPAERLVDLYFLLGWCFMKRGQVDEAIPLFRRCLRQSRRYPSPIDEAGALNNLGILYRMSGRPTMAMWYYKRVLKRHVAAGNMAEQANILINIGNLMRKDAKARCYFEKAVVAATACGNHMLLSKAEYSVADTYMPQPRGRSRTITPEDVKRAELDRARTLFLLALEHARLADDAACCIFSLKGLGMVSLFSGSDEDDPPLIYECAKRIIDIAIGLPPHIAQEVMHMRDQFVSHGDVLDRVVVDQRLKELGLARLINTHSHHGWRVNPGWT